MTQVLSPVFTNLTTTGTTSLSSGALSLNSGSTSASSGTFTTLSVTETFIPAAISSNSFGGGSNYAADFNSAQTVLYPISGGITAPFCVEFWINLTTSSARSTTFSGGPTARVQMEVDTAGVYVYIQGGHGYTGITALTTIALNTWTHIAYIASGSTTYIFVGGVLIATGTAPGGYVSPVGSWYGTGASNTFYFGPGSNYLISNFRVVTSSAVYPLTGFTPPTSVLTPITGTQVLLWVSNSTADSSTNHTALTTTSSLPLLISNTIPLLNNITIGTGGSVLQNAILQATGNNNSPSQISAQNISSGTSASTDFIAVADNGTDSINYVDFGINSSTNNDSTFTIAGVNDGYLYSASSNLAIGTATSGKNITLFAGGTLTANTIATVSSTGVAVTGGLSVTGTVSGAGFAGYAPLASPTFTGTPLAPTATTGTNTTQLATTAFVGSSISPLAPLASPTFTGTPAAPTATAGTNTTQIATTAYVVTSHSGYALLASPTFTGTPLAPTATTGTNTTQIATTAFVGSSISGLATLASPTFTGTPLAPTATTGTNTTQIATTAFVASGFASLASPTFTGTPAAPTATTGTSTTQIATTAFVASGFASLASPTFTGTPAAPTASTGTSTTQLATTAFVGNSLSNYALKASPTFTGTPLAPTATTGTNTTQLATTAFVASSLATLTATGDATGTTTGTALALTLASTGVTAGGYAQVQTDAKGRTIAATPGYCYYASGFSNSSGVTFGTQASFAIGTGDFTIEAWIYPTSTPIYSVIFDLRSSGPVLTLVGATLALWKGDSTTVASGGGVTTNAWNHVAAVRSSGVTRLYVNGVNTASGTDTNSYSSSATNYIGGGEGGSPLLGNISNVRVTTNAVYTTAFTPPNIALTAITGTIMLTLQSPTFVDNGPNNITLTTVGTPTLTNASTTKFPLLGTFGTLYASGSVSGAGFTSMFASPSPIGSTTPSSGAFTTLKSSGNFAVNGATPPAKPTVTGAKGSNAALASLISALVSYGLITDSTTA